MNRFWNSVLHPLLETVGPRLIVEVGVAQGALTGKLLGWAAQREVIVHAIDPSPEIDVRAWQAEHREHLVFHTARSLNVLRRLKGVDAALIDGDHNWYTVMNELRLLERIAAKARLAPPVIALHDIDWPYGRRDVYYDPDTIPAAHRHPYERKGILPGHPELCEGGLNEDLNNAIAEQTIHNGVRAAIDDFLSESAVDWDFFHVPGLRGLGILVPAERLQHNQSLRSLLKWFRSARFLSTWCDEIEASRIDTEIAVANRGRAVDRLETETAAGARALAEQLEAGRELRTQLEAEIGRLEQAIGEAVATEEQLRRDLNATRDRLAQLQSERLPASGRDGPGLRRRAAAGGVESVRRGLDSVLGSFEKRMNLTIAERDAAFNGDQAAYFAVSRSAIAAIAHALIAADIRNPRMILDLPSGYGRVTRALRSAWPGAELVAADPANAAVSFCVEQFGAQGWEVERYPPNEVYSEHRHRYDLIWSGSLLASLDPEHLNSCIWALVEMLAPDGLLVAAYHGRDSAQRISSAGDAALRSIAGSVDSVGVGFVPREPDIPLGTTAMSPGWLLSRLASHRGAMVISLTERGWADHLDVVALMRRPVHYAQLAAPPPPEAP